MTDRITSMDADAIAHYEEMSKGTLASVLGIKFIEVQADRIVATMPVGRQVHQPFGLLHGGASVALAETLASIGGWLNVDQSSDTVVGLEINANHIRSVRDGVVTGTATPVHLGRKTQVWDIRITDEQARLISISRCTVAVVPLQRD